MWEQVTQDGLDQAPGTPVARGDLKPQNRGSEGSGRGPLSATEAAGMRPGKPTGLAEANEVGKAMRSPTLNSQR